MHCIRKYGIQPLIEHICSSLTTNGEEELAPDTQKWLQDSNIMSDVSPDEHCVALAIKSSAVYIIDEKDVEIIHSSNIAGETITYILWITKDHIAVGYSSGLLCVFTKLGEQTFSKKLHSESILHLDLYTKSIPLVTLRSELWILYNDGTIVALPSQFLCSVDANPKVLELHKWQLEGQTDFSVALCCGPASPTLFQSHARFKSFTIISGASEPPLAFFIAGGDQRSAHLGQIASVVASKVATVAFSAVSSFAKNWGWSTEGATQEEGKDGSEMVAAEELNIYRGLDDERRRILSLVLDPASRLAATTDSLGRVMLIDTRYMQILRLWKGYRNSQCAWIQWPERWPNQSEGASIPIDGTIQQDVSYGLYLVIYAPLRGIVEVWRARYGPCVISIPIGFNARLFTNYSGGMRGNGRARCLLLNSHENLVDLTLSEITLDEEHLSLVYDYFSQNNNQEATLILHQVVSKLRSVCQTFRDASPSQKQALKPQLDALLTSIERINSWSLIERLLDEFEDTKTGCLGVDFHISATEILLKVVNLHKIRMPEYLHRLQLLWRKRLLYCYKRLLQECGSRCTRTKGDVNIVLATKATDVTEEWLEIARVIHLLSTPSSPSSFLQDDSVADLTTLSCIEFLNFFNVPKMLPSDMKLLDDTEEAIMAATTLAFKTGKINSLKGRGSLSPSQNQRILDFLYSPLLEDIFVVQSVRNIHRDLLLDVNENTEMFLDWFFSLSLGTLVSLPREISSLPLHRWLLILLKDNRENSSAPADHSNISSVGLPPLSEAGSIIYEYCLNSPRMIHVYVLTHHCALAEIEIAEAEESRTIGKISSAGAGKRWRLLQSCIMKIVYLSLRLGACGKITMTVAEKADEILRFIARTQLQNSWSVPQMPLVSTPVDNEVNTNINQLLLHELQSCNSRSELISASVIFNHFPGYCQIDNLCCFRAMELCKVWDRQPGQMKLLAAAIQHIKAITKADLQCGAGLAVWMNHLRIPALQLIQHWIENEGKTNHGRSIQPEVARPLFVLMQEILHIIIAATSSPMVESGEDSGQENSDGEVEDDDEDSEDNDVRYLRIGDFAKEGARMLMGNRTIQNFSMNWPPKISKLRTRLLRWKEHPPDLASLHDHLNLVRIMDALVGTKLQGSPLVLFSKHAKFCTDDGFAKRQDSETSTELRQLDERRLQFISQLLKHDDKLALSLAENFSLPLDKIRQERVLQLYWIGKDQLAEEAMMQLKDDRAVASRMGAIARWRLAAILKQMQSSSRYAPLMSNVPADTCAWISGDRSPLQLDALIKDGELPIGNCSLSATHNLLVRCMHLLDSSSEEGKWVARMCEVAKSLQETVYWAEQH